MVDSQGIFGLRIFAGITHNCKDNAGLMALRSAGSLRPPSASCCCRLTADSCESRWLWRRRWRGHSSGCHTRPIVVVTPYATDSELRIYSTCHRKDGSAGTPELIHRRYYRLAASLSGMAACVSRRGTCRVFALIHRCFFSYQWITGTSRMVRAAAKGFNHNSRASVSEALVRILKLRRRGSISPRPCD